MIIGDVVYPNLKRPRKRVSCISCNISYSNKSYKLLLNNYKLLFLDSLSTEIEHVSAQVCHDCFFDNLKRVAKEEGWEEGMVFYILTEKSELELKFQPEDKADDELRERSEDVYMEDFIKDILET